MEFKVVPFVAKITQKDSTGQVAEQLQTVINSYSSQGWDYVRMENVETYVDGTNGCFGFGAKPGYVTSYTVLVFKK
jgi:hypothetical protein